MTEEPRKRLARLRSHVAPAGTRRERLWVAVASGVRVCRYATVGALGFLAPSLARRSGEEMPRLSVLHTPKRDRHGPLIVSVSLVKNEADIIPAWMSHMRSTFDMLYVADHQSVDGTREFLMENARAHDNIQLFSLEHRGYYQAETTNYLARIAAREHPDAWILPIDADEFLSSSALPEVTLPQLDTSKALRLRWRNCIPVSLGADAQFNLATTCLISPVLSEWSKVAIHSSAILKKNWRFNQGNHSITDGLGRVLRGDTRIDSGELIHVPIRSIDHFALKCVQGHLAYRALPPNRDQRGQATHWTRMIGLVLEKEAMEPALLREFVATYSHPEMQTGKGMSTDDLTEAGWTTGPLTIAQVAPPADMVRRYGFIELARLALHETDAADPEIAEFLRIVAVSTDLGG